MSKSALIATLLLLSSTFAFAGTVNKATCTLVWDYNVEHEALIDGFKIYANDADPVVVAKEVRELACSELSVTDGEYTLTATAYNAVGESPKSPPVTVTFVSAAPEVPGNIKVEININITTN